MAADAAQPPFVTNVINEYRKDLLELRTEWCGDFLDWCIDQVLPGDALPSYVQKLTQITPVSFYFQ